MPLACAVDAAAVGAAAGAVRPLELEVPELLELLELCTALLELVVPAALTPACALFA